MMSREKLLALKKAARRKTAGMELPIATMHALLDSNLEALDQLEGGKTTQELRAELTERERQVGLALKDLRTELSEAERLAIHDLPSFCKADEDEGVRAIHKSLHTVDMINEMLKATGPKWQREWSWYTPRIEEEFGA
jgi:hypothetical protein